MPLISSCFGGNVREMQLVASYHNPLPEHAFTVSNVGNRNTDWQMQLGDVREQRRIAADAGR